METQRSDAHRLAPTPTGLPTQTPSWPSGQEPPPQWAKQSPQHRNPSCNEDLSRNVHNRAYISVRDKEMLRHYYEKVFQNLQQTNCRVLAKAYIKLVEPRKQVNYPYNGRKIVAGKTRQLDPDETKPPWWPSGVSHREPDHLPKAGKAMVPRLDDDWNGSHRHISRTHQAPRPSTLQSSHQPWNYRPEIERGRSAYSPPNLPSRAIADTR